MQFLYGMKFVSFLELAYRDLSLSELNLLIKC